MSWLVELLQMHHLFDFAQILRDHLKQAEFLHAFLKIKQLTHHFFLQASFHSRRHHVLKLIVVERVGHCLLATNGQSVIEEKGEGFENGKCICWLFGVPSTSFTLPCLHLKT